jgi:hypothetical protein
MPTFYFNGAVDSEWTTLDNWWMTFDGTNYSNQATSLPSSGDNVILNEGAVTSNTGSSITILSLTMNSGSYIQPQTEEDSIAIYVTNETILNGNSNITGHTTVNGDISLYNSASIGCVVSGNVILNGTSYILGIDLAQIDGDVVFKDYSHFNGGISSSTNLLDIIGTATFNDYSYVDYTSNAGLRTSNAIFNDSSYVLSDTGGVAAIDNIIFNDDSYISYYGYASSVDGTIIFNDDSYIEEDGSVVGTSLVIFNHNSYMTDNALIYQGVDNVIFNDSSINKVGLGTVVVNRTKGVNGSSILGIV